MSDAAQLQAAMRSAHQALDGLQADAATLLETVRTVRDTFDALTATLAEAREARLKAPAPMDPAAVAQLEQALLRDLPRLAPSPVPAADELE